MEGSGSIFLRSCATSVHRCSGCSTALGPQMALRIARCVSTRSWFRASSDSSSNSLGVRRISVSLPQHAPAVVVDRQVADAQPPVLAGLVGRHAAQRDANARQQLLRTKRLGDVVVGAQVERVHLVSLGAARRQHDDRHAEEARTRRQTSVPSRSGKPEVEHDQVGRPLGRQPRAPRRRCRRRRPRTRAIAAAAPPRAESTLRHRRAGCDVRRHALGRAVVSDLRAAGTTMVNAAPPSGQFSAQTRPRSTASRPRAIQRPMPVPEARDRAAVASIEPFEQVRQIGLERCPGRGRARGCTGLRRSPGATLIAEPGGVYCAAFSSRCASAGRSGVDRV